jgi:steroid 5-alpha reductase family enzyme
MNNLNNYILISAVTLGAFSAVYLIALYLKKNSVVDIFWGLGFIIVAITSLVTSLYFGLPQIIITSLVFLWGTRLGIRIYLRSMGKNEDRRYAQWRENWGKYAYIRGYTDVFLLQGVLCLIISIPIIYVNTQPLEVKNPVIFTLGIIVWLFGFIFEAIGDNQLDNFTEAKHPKGTVLDTGLWKYTRHPNYFGESSLWWGISIIILSCTPTNFAILIGPITITFLLVKVSGIPLLEKKMSQNPKYREYMKITNKFIPGKPKS